MPREFAVMESYCEVMKPLVETTEAVGAEKWITISYVRPLLHKLLTTYLIPVESDMHVEKALKRVMLNNLSDCYIHRRDSGAFKQSIVPGPTF